MGVQCAHFPYRGKVKQWFGKHQHARKDSPKTGLNAAPTCVHEHTDTAKPQRITRDAMGSALNAITSFLATIMMLTTSNGCLKNATL